MPKDLLSSMFDTPEPSEEDITLPTDGDGYSQENEALAIAAIEAELEERKQDEPVDGGILIDFSDVTPPGYGDVPEGHTTHAVDPPVDEVEVPQSPHRVSFNLMTDDVAISFKEEAPFVPPSEKHFRPNRFRDILRG